MKKYLKINNNYSHYSYFVEFTGETIAFMIELSTPFDIKFCDELSFNYYKKANGPLLDQWKRFILYDDMEIDDNEVPYTFRNYYVYSKYKYRVKEIF